LYPALSPAQGLPSTGWDKLNHVLAFGALGTLATLAWPAQVSLSLVLLFGYGILIEVLQSFTPPARRSCWTCLRIPSDCCSLPRSGRQAPHWPDRAQAERPTRKGKTRTS